MSRFRAAAIALVTPALVLALAATPAVADHAPGTGAAAHAALKGTRVRIAVEPDAIKGYNLFVTTKKFEWAPTHVNREHRSGEGHAHLFIDGEKVTRLYGPAYYLGGLNAGTHTIRVTLNGNDHGDYMRGDRVVESQVEVDVPSTPATAPMTGTS